MNSNATGAAKDRSHELLIGEIADEFVEQLDRGEQPDIEEYVRRHPDIADSLRPILNTLLLMGNGLTNSGIQTASSPKSPETSQVLGDFRILREIGRGGMGIVYEAEQISVGRRVALKVLPFAAVMDSKQLARFRNEVHAAGQLHHTNIVPVFTVGSDRGAHYYAMQYIEGHTLAEVVSELQSAKRETQPKSVTVPHPSSRGERVAEAALSPGAPGARVRGADMPCNHAMLAEDGAATEKEKPRRQRGVEATILDSANVPVASCASRDSISTSTLVAALSTEYSTKPREYFRSVARLGVQAAEALDHAHQLGILHRDIKPSNLLLDVRGNLWVTDFGLARIVASSGAEGSTGRELTMTGELLGTIRYMSPEQALAKRVIVDHRTDIYSLGVTLCELLTLHSAFPGADRQEVLRQIAFDDPQPPRRANPLVPVELETIVLKACAKNPSERYATAQELADDLGRFVRQEPIRAKRPTLLQRSRSWARRHRPIVWSVASCLLFATAILTGSVGWLIRDQTARRTATETLVQSAVEEAKRLLDQQKLSEAISAARRADGLLVGGASVEVTRSVKNMLRDLELLERLEAIYLDKAEVFDGRTDYGALDERYAHVFAEFGIELSLPQTVRSMQAIRESFVFTNLVPFVDDWAMVRRKARGEHDTTWMSVLNVAQSADSDSVRAVLREVLKNPGRADLDDLRSLASPEIESTPTLVLLAATMTRFGRNADALSLLRAASQLRPADFWIHCHLASVLHEAKPPQWAEYLHHASAALALRPENAEVMQQFGDALRHNGDFEGSVAAFRKAIRLNPKNLNAHHNFGVALAQMGRIDEAIAEYQAAIRLDPEQAITHRNLAIELSIQRSFDAAIDEYREVIRLLPNDAEAHNDLGKDLAESGRVADSILEFREAIALNPECAQAHCSLGTSLLETDAFTEAVEECRTAVRLQPEVALYHYSLGNALLDTGDPDAGIDEFRASVRLEPNVADYHCGLGRAVRHKGDLKEAMDEYNEAIRLAPESARAHHGLGLVFLDAGSAKDAIRELSQAIELQPDNAIAHNALGTALSSSGAPQEAIAEFREAIRLGNLDAHYNLANALYDVHNYDEAINEFRHAVSLKPDSWEVHDGLGLAQLELARHGVFESKNNYGVQLAIDEFRAALSLNPDFAPAHNHFAIALRMLGHFDEAINEHSEALRLNPDDHEAHLNLGFTFDLKGDLDAAIAEYREATRLKPQLVDVHFHLAVALCAKRCFLKAISEYEVAVGLKPEFAEAQCNLGILLRDTGRFSEGLTHLRRGHELGSRDPQWSYPSAKWVQECDRLVELESKLERNEKPNCPLEEIEYADLCRKKQLFAASANFYDDAFTESPQLAEDLERHHRYNAACSAALAGSGKGEDATSLDDAERARLRRQALDWLEADLAYWKGQLDRASTSQADSEMPAKLRATVHRLVRHWLQDTDLAGVRDRGAPELDQLPEAEREAWEKMWAEVAEVLREMSGE